MYEDSDVEANSSSLRKGAQNRTMVPTTDAMNKLEVRLLGNEPLFTAIVGDCAIISVLLNRCAGVLVPNLRNKMRTVAGGSTEMSKRPFRQVTGRILLGLFAQTTLPFRHLPEFLS